LIVIFNGPPGSGKDEAARYFESCGFTHLSFKHRLFKETFAHFGVTKTWFMNRYNDREVKERPEEYLNGMSRREALIFVSEEIMKPRFGNDIFGVAVANEVEDGFDYCISDGGFVEELVPLINRVGADNIVLVQLTRKGRDYSTDSRRYFNGMLVKEYVIGHATDIIQSHILERPFPIRTYRVHNNGSLEDFYQVLYDIHEKERNEQSTTKEESCITA
jgi:hypothetical protein